MSPKRAPVVIGHPGELDRLSVLPLRRLPGQPRVALSPSLVAGEARVRLELDLNRYLFACGCAQSATGILLALAAYGAWAVFAGAGAGVAAHVGRALLAMAAGAVVGKAAGLLRAEVRLRETIRRIRAAVPAHGPWEHSPLEGEPTCY